MPRITESRIAESRLEGGGVQYFHRQRCLIWPTNTDGPALAMLPFAAMRKPHKKLWWQPYYNLVGRHKEGSDITMTILRSPEQVQIKACTTGGDGAQQEDESQPQGQVP